MSSEGKTEKEMDQQYTFTQGMLAGMLLGIRVERFFSSPESQGCQDFFDSRTIQGSVLVTVEETAAIGETIMDYLKQALLGQAIVRFDSGIPEEVIDYSDALLRYLTTHCSQLV